MSRVPGQAAKHTEDHNLLRSKRGSDLLWGNYQKCGFDITYLILNWDQLQQTDGNFRCKSLPKNQMLFFSPEEKNLFRSQDLQSALRQASVNI